MKQKKSTGKKKSIGTNTAETEHTMKKRCIEQTGKTLKSGKKQPRKRKQNTTRKTTTSGKMYRKNIMKKLNIGIKGKK